MLRQVANFLGMASRRHLHIKRVGGRPHFLVRVGRSQLGHLLREGRLGLAREVSQAVVSDRARGLGVGGGEQLGRGPGREQAPPWKPPPLARHLKSPSTLISGWGALGGHVSARVGARLSPSAVIKSRLEIDGRGYRGGYRGAQLSDLLALNSNKSLKYSRVRGTVSLKTTLVLELQCRH